MQMVSELETFIEEEGAVEAVDTVIAIRDMDYILRKRKVEEMKNELFGI